MSVSLESLKKYTNNNIFVETGTFHGATVNCAILAGFRDIISIEISEELQNKNRERFIKYPQIKLYTGDSEVVLWSIIKDIKEPITFYLDGHIHPPWVNIIGIRQVPLLQELETIEKHPIKIHTILIDDRRMMSSWPGPSEKDVENKLFEINPKYEILYEDTYNAKRDIVVARIVYDTNI